MRDHVPARAGAPIGMGEAAGDEPPRDRPETKELVALGAVMLAGIALRLPFVGQTSLWLDEMWSIAISRMPWRSLGSVVLNQDSNASLYYALLHLWMMLGEGEAHVRLLSVIAGAATIPAVYFLAKRLADARAGLVASILVAVNGFHIQFSQEARTYSVAVLLATLSSWLFVKSVEEPAWRNWAAYVLASVLAVHAHVFALLVVASHAVSLPWAARREVRWTRVVASAVAVGVLLLPLGALLLARAREPNAPLGWVNRPSLRTVAGLFWSLSGNPSVSPGSNAPDAVRGAPLLAVYGSACLVALVGFVRAWRTWGSSRQAWRLSVVLCWLVVPVVLTVAASMHKPVFVAKYLIVCMPAMVLLAALGIASLERRWAQVSAVVAVVGLTCVLGLPRYYASSAANREWPAATSHLLANARPGDALVFFVAPGRLLFDYYRAKVGRTDPGELNVLYPEFQDGDQGPRTLGIPLPPVRSDLPEIAARERRLWLVLYHDEFADTAPVRRELETWLMTRFRKVKEDRFAGLHERVELQLYERRP